MNNRCHRYRSSTWTLGLFWYFAGRWIPRYLASGRPL